MIKRIHWLAILAVMLVLSFGSSLGADRATSIQKLRRFAAQEAERVASSTLEPNEINSIKYRRELMGKPGLQMYVVFFNQMGQPVEYFVTKGKCTSSFKRLTCPWEFVRGQTGVNSDGSVMGDFVMERPSEDGAEGESDHYIYCETVNGRYKQWNGFYYASDAPIELNIEPIVVEVTKSSK